MKKSSFAAAVLVLGIAGAVVAPAASSAPVAASEQPVVVAEALASVQDRNIWCQIFGC